MRKLNREKLIRKGRLCGKCNVKTIQIDSFLIYKTRSYGMIRICPICEAFVGVDKKGAALGSVADPETRKWRKEAHRYFDNLWQQKVDKGFEKRKARPAAYRWLADVMKLHPDHAHIAQMNAEECKKLIEFCKPYFKENESK